MIDDFKVFVIPLQEPTDFNSSDGGQKPPKGARKENQIWLPKHSLSYLENTSQKVPRKQQNKQAWGGCSNIKTERHFYGVKLFYWTDVNK